MLAIDFIDSKFLPATKNAGKDELKQLFINQKTSHLPIISSENKFIGILPEDDIDTWILDKDEETLLKHSCFNYQHIYECTELFANDNLSSLPIVDETNTYKGAISLRSLTDFVAQLTATQFPGAVIVLELGIRDYSLVEIAQIIESNGGKIMSLHTEQAKESIKLKVTLRLNTKETASILETFRRYDYNIISHFIGNDAMERFYHNRIDELIKYINM